MLQIPVSYTSIYIVFRSFKLKVFNLFGVSGFLSFKKKDLLLFLIVCMYKCLSLYLHIHIEAGRRHWSPGPVVSC